MTEASDDVERRSGNAVERPAGLADADAARDGGDEDRTETPSGESSGATFPGDEVDPALAALVADLDLVGPPTSPQWPSSPEARTSRTPEPFSSSPRPDSGGPTAGATVHAAPPRFVADETIDGTPGPPPVAADSSGAVPERRVHPSPSRFSRPLPRVVAIANQKGGVGKTTTAVNLSAALAEQGFRVLVVDLDPQGNASTGLGINIRDLQTSMYDVLLRDVPLEDCIEATAVRNLFVAPANLDLAGAEIELVPAFSRELKLRRALEAVVSDYDFVFVDCPPSLGLLTVNSLAAASEVLVPIQCEYYALEGLGQLMRNVGLVQKNLNPNLELSVIVCVMYDARTKLAEQVVREVRSHFGDTVCRTIVPRTVRLSEAPSYGQPILAFDPTSRGAIAYRELAKEVSGGPPQRAG